MSDEVRFRWAEVEPLGVVNGKLNHVLTNVDTLREAWDVSLAQASPGEFAEARRRSLTRHAIETGIIERLYDPSGGVTEALVAEQAICRTQATYEAHNETRRAITASSRFSAFGLASSASTRLLTLIRALTDRTPATDLIARCANVGLSCSPVCTWIVARAMSDSTLSRCEVSGHLRNEDAANGSAMSNRPRRR